MNKQYKTLASLLLWYLAAACAHAAMQGTNPNPQPPSTEFISSHSVKVDPSAPLPREVFETVKKFKVVTVGEMHGTIESQAFVLSLVELSRTNGQSVAVGLEIPDSEQDSLNQYLANGDVEILKRMPFFQRSFQDGRSSEAMAKLLYELRKAPEIKVICYDTIKYSNPQERDTQMAANLAKTFTQIGQKPLIVLAGNVHSAITIGTPWDANYRPMGYELSHLVGTPFKAEDVYSIKIRYQGGNAWVCMSASSCGVTELSNPPSNYSAALQWNSYFLEESTIWDGYNATFYTKWLTASPPFGRSQ